MMLFSTYNCLQLFHTGPVQLNETERVTQTVPKDGEQNCQIKVYPGGAILTASFIISRRGFALKCYSTLILYCKVHWGQCMKQIYFQATMTSGSGDFLIADNIYPNKAHNDQDQTLITNRAITFSVSCFELLVD